MIEQGISARRRPPGPQSWGRGLPQRWLQRPPLGAGAAAASDASIGVGLSPRIGGRGAGSSADPITAALRHRRLALSALAVAVAVVPAAAQPPVGQPPAPPAPVSPAGPASPGPAGEEKGAVRALTIDEAVQLALR